MACDDPTTLLECRDANVFTVDLPAGSALLLPAYWYHQVESLAEPGKLNVAVNYWYQACTLLVSVLRSTQLDVEALQIGPDGALIVHPSPGPLAADASLPHDARESLHQLL